MDSDKIIKTAAKIAAATTKAVIVTAQESGKVVKAMAQAVDEQVKEEQKKNVFAERPDNYHFLINCTETGRPYFFEVLDSDKKILFKVESWTTFGKYRLCIMDENERELINVTKKLTETYDVDYNDERYQQLASDLKERLEKITCVRGLLGIKFTYRDQTGEIGYVMKKAGYTGGQFVLDFKDFSNGISLMVLEIIREMKYYDSSEGLEFIRRNMV